MATDDVVRAAALAGTPSLTELQLAYADLADLLRYVTIPTMYDPRSKGQPIRMMSDAVGRALHRLHVAVHQASESAAQAVGAPADQDKIDAAFRAATEAVTKLVALGGHWEPDQLAYAAVKAALVALGIRAAATDDRSEDEVPGKGGGPSSAGVQASMPRDGNAGRNPQGAPPTGSPLQSAGAPAAPPCSHQVGVPYCGQPGCDGFGKALYADGWRVRDGQFRAPAAPAPDREKHWREAVDWIVKHLRALCELQPDKAKCEPVLGIADALEEGAAASLRAFHPEVAAAPGRAPAPEPTDDEAARIAVEEAIETAGGDGQRFRHITDAEREALDTYYCAAYETGWVNALAHGVSGGAPPAAPEPKPLREWCGIHRAFYDVNDCPLCAPAARPAEPPPARVQEAAALGEEFARWWELVKDAKDPNWRRVEHHSVFAVEAERLRAAPPPSEAPRG